MSVRESVLSSETEKETVSVLERQYFRGYVMGR